MLLCVYNSQFLGFPNPGTLNPQLPNLQKQFTQLNSPYSQFYSPRLTIYEISNKRTYKFQDSLWFLSGLSTNLPTPVLEPSAPLYTRLALAFKPLDVVLERPRGLLQAASKQSRRSPFCRVSLFQFSFHSSVLTPSAACSPFVRQGLSLSSSLSPGFNWKQLNPLFPPISSSARANLSPNSSFPRFRSRASV